MIRTVAVHTFRAILLIFIQIFVLNNINFGGVINPYIYILIILYLPIQTPAWLTQILSFIVGISIDLMVETPGMHTSATVFAGFLRPYVLKYISPRDGYEPEVQPNIKEMGISWFMRYTLILTFAHHALLFFVESYNTVNYINTSIRVILSLTFTVLLITILQYIQFGKTRKR